MSGASSEEKLAAVFGPTRGSRQFVYTIPDIIRFAYQRTEQDSACHTLEPFERSETHW